MLDAIYADFTEQLRRESRIRKMAAWEAMQASGMQLTSLQLEWLAKWRKEMADERLKKGWGE